MVSNVRVIMQILDMKVNLCSY